MTFHCFGWRWLLVPFVCGVPVVSSACSAPSATSCKFLLQDARGLDSKYVFFCHPSGHKPTYSSMLASRGNERGRAEREREQQAVRENGKGRVGGKERQSERARLRERERALLLLLLLLLLPMLRQGPECCPEHMIIRCARLAISSCQMCIALEV